MVHPPCPSLVSQSVVHPLILSLPWVSVSSFMSYSIQYTCSPPLNRVRVRVHILCFILHFCFVIKTARRHLGSRRPNSQKLHQGISSPCRQGRGEELPCKHWTTLNRLRMDVGRLKSPMQSWGLSDSFACECGATEQTADLAVIDPCTNPLEVRQV